MISFDSIGVTIYPSRNSNAKFSSDQFHIIRETLSRMGLKNEKDKTLTQSAHILHKQGQYKIVHFKEMFKLDGKPTTIYADDLERRNYIIGKLIDWELAAADIERGESEVDIIPFEEKSQWTLKQNYTIGKKPGVNYASIKPRLLNTNQSL